MGIEESTTVSAKRRKKLSGQADKAETPKPPILISHDSLTKAFETIKNIVYVKTNIIGELIRQYDFAFLFGTTGIGKSWLLYHMAEAMATGKNLFDVNNIDLVDRQKDYYRLNNAAPAMYGIYLDFEMNLREIRERYKNGAGEYFQFNEHIKPCFPSDDVDPEKNIDYFDAIEKIIMADKTAGIERKFLIVDNLQAIGYRIEESVFASQLMRRIKRLKNKFDLTVVVCAHTPKGKENKIRQASDMQGSAIFGNMIDTLISIDEIKDSPQQIYVKQHKLRYGKKKFGENNVLILEFRELPDGFKGFGFIGYEDEENLHQCMEKTDKKALNVALIEMWNNTELSIHKIADKLYYEYGKNRIFDSFRKNINNYILKLLEEGEITNDRKAPTMEIKNDETTSSTMTQFVASSVAVNTTSPEDFRIPTSSSPDTGIVKADFLDELRDRQAAKKERESAEDLKEILKDYEALKKAQPPTPPGL